MKVKEAKESMQILVDVVNDKGMAEENKFILFRQGFISGAMSVLYAQENIDANTTKEVLDQIAVDLNLNAIEHYERFVNTLKNKKEFNKAAKVIKNLS